MDQTYRVILTYPTSAIAARERVEAASEEDAHEIGQQHVAGGDGRDYVVQVHDDLGGWRNT